jgi:hypothetical protein
MQQRRNLQKMASSYNATQSSHGVHVNTNSTMHDAPDNVLPQEPGSAAVPNKRGLEHRHPVGPSDLDLN